MDTPLTAPLISGSEFWMMIFKSLGMLCIVLAILIGILFMIRKFSFERGSGQDKSLIRMLSSFYLSPKERVVLLKVMDKTILIGVTQNTITRISEFDSEEDLPTPRENGDGPFFKNLLQRISANTVATAESGPSFVSKPGV